MDDKRKNITISVIILTKNGAETLDRCLGAVFSQCVDRHFEVICIDSGSRDNTLAICRNYRVRLFQIKQEEFNHGLTRNFAISKARGEYVIFLSQDAIPLNNNWMKPLIDNLINNTEMAASYSRQVPFEDADEFTKMDVENHPVSKSRKEVRYIINRRIFDNLMPQERLEFCSFDNVSSCIRKSVWEEIPFPKIDFAEDLAWAKKVIESGKKIVFEPLSVVAHSHKRSILYEFRRSYIHHYKTYELFGFNPVSTLDKIFTFAALSSLSQIRQLINRKRPALKILYPILKIPFISLSRVIGQYKGARDAKLAIADADFKDRFIK